MIINYDEKYDEQLLKLNSLLFYKIKYHPDTIKDSVYMAVERGILLGVALLLKRSSFLAMEANNLQYHELIIDYGVDKTYQDNKCVQFELMEKLKEKCDEISKQYPGKRIFIKTWEPEEEHPRIEQFMKQGFVIGRSTPILVRQLDAFKEIDTSSPKLLKVKNNNNIESIEIKEIHFNDELFSSYENATRNAFAIPDSIQDLQFKLNDPEIKVFAAVRGNLVISSVTIWRISKLRAATENIFCLDTYRRKGITSAVIDYACSYLKHTGFTEASLTVYQDNTPAFLLYEKLGYRYEKLNIGIQYETSYKAIPY